MLKNGKAIFIGAPEFLLKDYKKYKDEVDNLTSYARVVAVVEYSNYNKKMKNKNY